MGDGCMLLDGRNQQNLRKQFIPQLKQNTDSVVVEKLWFRTDSSLGAGVGATFLKTYGQGGTENLYEDRLCKAGGSKKEVEKWGEMDVR